MQKRRILYLSMSIPYSRVPHAGGKTFYYYISSFAGDKNNEVTLIAKVLPEEESEVSGINPRIRTLPVRTPENKVKKMFACLKSLNSKLNPLYPYGNVLSKEIYDQMERQLDRLREADYRPDIVILEWTWLLLFIDRVKKRFPEARYVASEHDVSFLGAGRNFEALKKAGIRKLYRELYYRNLKNRELSCISSCDYVVTHNDKDRQLLQDNGIPASRLGVIVPYFERRRIIKRRNIGRDIIFYGAMNRHENVISALWFIRNVMPRIEDLDIRYVIIGNRPDNKLKKYESERICLTGFVEDVSPYFSTAKCLAAPIQAGAGVKIKILEAMAMGVPVLTNDMGIEGINAEDGIHYLHCETPEEYESVIRKICGGNIDAEKIAQSALKMIENNYDIEKSFREYSGKIYSLL